MTDADATDRVNALLTLAFETALDLTINHHLTEEEQAKARLCLAHPSDLIAEARNDADAIMVDGLNAAITHLLNTTLFPDEYEPLAIDDDDDS